MSLPTDNKSPNTCNALVILPQSGSNGRCPARAAAAERGPTGAGYPRPAPMDFNLFSWGFAQRGQVIALTDRRKQDNLR